MGADPKPHLGSTVALTLMVGALVTFPKGVSMRELAPRRVCHGWDRVGKGDVPTLTLAPCHIPCGRADPGVMRSGDLSLSLTCCNIWESRPDTLPGTEELALDVGVAGESSQGV